MIPTHAALWATLALAPLTVPPEAATADPVEWQFGPIADALAKAKAEDQLALLYFWADGSEFCGKLYQETLANERAQPLLAKMVCYSAKHGSETAELFERFKVRTLPTLLFVDGDGRAEDAITGFIPVDDFVGECARIQRGEGTLSGLTRAVSAATDLAEELELRFQLAGKLDDLQDRAGHDEQLELIRERDPKGETETGATVLLWEAQEHVFTGGKGLGARGEGGEGGDGVWENIEERAKSWDLTPMYALARKIKPKKVRFDAWNRIANMEAQKGEPIAAVAAFQHAEKLVPDDQVADWSADVANWICKSNDHMTSKERKYALTLATNALEAAENARKRAQKEAGRQRQGEGEGAGGGEATWAVDYDQYVGRQYATLARAYLVNRKHRQAKKAAARAVELFDCDEHRAVQTEVEKGVN